MWAGGITYQSDHRTELRLHNHGGTASTVCVYLEQDQTFTTPREIAPGCHVDFDFELDTRGEVLHPHVMYADLLGKPQRVVCVAAWDRLTVLDATYWPSSLLTPTPFE